MSNLGFDSQREPPHQCSVRLHQHIRRCLAIQQGVAKSEVIGEKDYPGEIAASNPTEFPALPVARKGYRMELDSPVSRSSHNLISYLKRRQNRFKFKINENLIIVYERNVIKVYFSFIIT